MDNQVDRPAAFPPPPPPPPDVSLRQLAGLCVATADRDGLTVCLLRLKKKRKCTSISGLWTLKHY